MSTGELVKKDVATLRIKIDQLKSENETLEMRNKEFQTQINSNKGKMDQYEQLVDFLSSELEGFPNVENVTNQLQVSVKI
mmetsp:Transcript_9588/g.8438  ORF Transcript_9588/g.8438 Transcript_9588/m.8438 type:complete len:80 (+) Transcript_9588:12-251(+)